MEAGADAYGEVERAGAVLTESEMRVDGSILREKNNSEFAVKGSTV